MRHFNILIVGSGHAGAQAAIALRQSDIKGTVGMIGEEPDLPYERPTLSKEYLIGDKPFERILIRAETFWAERGIVIVKGRRVVSVDPAAHRVTLDDGTVMGYGKLIWATGGAARTLTCPGGTADGIHVIRTRADVDAIVAKLDRVARVVIIGGGYIGLEAAAAMIKLGKDVVLLEALDRVLARVAGEPLSRFYEQEHRSRGVDLRTGAMVESIKCDGGKIEGVVLQDGEVIPADLVIVGIGIVPAVDALLAAGAIGGNGVEVDGLCRTSLDDIYAIGDCAAHVNRFADGAMMRVESVQNANDQAKVVVAHLRGETAEYDAVPWFWSNQYDLKLQTVGLSVGHDQAIVRGDPANRSFSVVYLRRGKVIALDCVNAVRDYVQGRALVVAGVEAPATALADIAIPLKELAPA